MVDKITYYLQKTWPKWLVPYLLVAPSCCNWPHIFPELQHHSPTAAVGLSTRHWPFDGVHFTQCFWIVAVTICYSCSFAVFSPIPEETARSPRLSTTRWLDVWRVGSLGSAPHPWIWWSPRQGSAAWGIPVNDVPTSECDDSDDPASASLSIVMLV